ncbi:hypothetical protein BKA65DRAFT_473843 [Rhexocercosporidium sp. MPI-PUGE-AT-0058]|nr:hypothetical protein BKA65DRAFT_473843 [Rhexocercosporidium sp. MPI-PUGE-AT-0058]
MQLHYLYISAALISCASSIYITSPTVGDIWDLSYALEIKWDKILGEASSAHLRLVQTGGYRKVVAQYVNTSAETYTLEPLGGIPTGTGFQLEFLETSAGNSAGLDSILGRSNQFEIRGIPPSPSASTSSSVPTSTDATSKPSGPTTESPSTTPISTPSPTPTAGDDTATSNTLKLSEIIGIVIGALACLATITPTLPTGYRGCLWAVANRMKIGQAAYRLQRYL